MPEYRKPTLSVIIATVHPWPEIQRCLDSVYPQIVETNSELIITSAVKDAIPEHLRDQYESLKVLFTPKADVFELRAKALAAAQGEIIAITEDHCAATENWCANIIKSHENHPDSPAIAGSVLNGSPESPFDRANYFSIFADFIPPMQTDRINHIPPAANITFKRSAIKTTNVRRGWLEIKYSGQLLNNHQYIFDNSFSVYHIQSHGGILGNCAMHFHNGRATTAMMMDNQAIENINDKLKGLVTLPFKLLNETQAKLKHKDISANIRMINILPLFAITLSHTVGELIGILYGPGKSTHQLN